MTKMCRKWERMFLLSETGTGTMQSLDNVTLQKFLTAKGLRRLLNLSKP